MVYVIAKCVTKNDTIEETKTALEKLVEATKKEDGCLQYDLLQDPKNQTIFFFSEIWETEAQLGTHSKSEHLAAWIKHSEKVLALPMEISVLAKVK